jgi:pyrroline-5-carboxylate reductase
MMVETGMDPAELRRQVTSPGGVTQAALQSLNWSGVNEAIKHAVLVAMRRGKELGK